MASIGSRDVQENIVGPLMDMMGQLSAEMRKNLTHEVSNLGRKVDELSRKVDHLINIVEGNAGNHKFVSEKAVLKAQTIPRTYRSANETHYSRYNDSSYKHAENSHVSEMVDNGRNSEENSKPRIKAENDKTESKNDEYSEQVNLDTRRATTDENDASIRENAKDTIPNEESIDPEHIINVGMLTENQEPSPLLNTNGYAKGIHLEDKHGPDEVKVITSDEDEEDDSSDDSLENIVQTELEMKQVNDEISTITLLNNAETEAENFSNEKIECLQNGSISTEDTSSNESFSGSTKEKTERRIVNFGMKEAPNRPESPFRASDTKIDISYASFKRSRTEFTVDNRTIYLKGAFNVMEYGTDVNKTKVASVDYDRSTNNADSNVDKKGVQPPDGNEPIVVSKTVKINNRDVDKGDHLSSGHEPVGKENSFDTTDSNNHQLSASGLHNEHGVDDNRFNAAAHEDIIPSSVTRRTAELSNLKLVKNGLMHALGSSSDNYTSPRRTDRDAADSIDQPKPKDPIPDLVPDDVLYSLIEKERIAASECKDMKSTGIDTVICLDTSSSMAGKPLTTAITCIERILDGFETNAVYHDLEENVALVTFGNENKIRHHLTNDYGQIRDGLADIKAGGPSPLWLGLALSLTEIKERGGACLMEPMSVLPRVILITDGFVSRKNCLNGDDNGVVDDQVIREMLSLMNTCSSFTSYMECIKTGKCHEEFLKSLSNGRIYTSDDTDSITEFFKIQEKANTIIKQVKSDEIDRTDINGIIENSKLNEKGKEDLRIILSASLPSNDEQTSNSDTGPQSEDEPAVTHPKTSEEVDQPKPAEPSETLPPESLDMSDDVKAPPFGTAVLPNPKWVGFASRQTLSGTVVGPRKKGLMKILWSDGTTDRCKFGVNGQYDILVSEDQSVDSSKIHIGSIVERGKDWRWKDQDGGEGSVGVVSKIDGYVVHVNWSHGGIGNYRYGYNKKYDLKLRESRYEKRYAWYLEVESGQSEMFPKEVNDNIEQMYKAKHAGTFLVNMDTQSLRISLTNLQARDTNTQASYNIERRELPDGELPATKD